MMADDLDAALREALQYASSTDTRSDDERHEEEEKEDYHEQV
jgi:hypothetical protein